MTISDASDSVLVVGVPRSGTTWVGQVLGLAAGVRSVNEPDNEANVPLAVKAKRTLGRFPVLGAGEGAPSAYDRLWEGALHGRMQPKAPRWYVAMLLLRRVDRSELRAGFCEPSDARLSTTLRAVAALSAPPPRRDGTSIAIVKSINAALALEWITARFKPRVVVVLRHPFNVIASWVELGWRDCNLDRHPRVRERFLEGTSILPLAVDASPLARVTWQVGLLTRALEMGISAHPEWTVVSHETLCSNPNAEFRGLYEALGLGWSNEVDSWLDEVNRPGTGTVAHRVASDLPEGWRRRLDAAQLQEIREVLAGFPLASWPTDFEGAGGR